MLSHITIEDLDLFSDEELISLKSNAMHLINRLRLDAIRLDVKLYCRYILPNFNWEWFHDVVCDMFNDFIKAGIGAGIYETQNQAGKSLLFSQMFPSYYLMRYPHKSVIYASYVEKRAEGAANDLKIILMSSQFEQITPHFRIKWNQEFETSEEKKANRATTLQFTNAAYKNSRGRFLACGVGGMATGIPAHLIILDDVFKNEKDAFSQTIRDNAWSFAQSVLSTRQQSRHQGVIQLVTNTRNHSDDVVGRFKKENDKAISQGRHKEGYIPWRVITHPALKEEKHMCNQYDIREVGEWLLPARGCNHEIITLEELKNNISSYKLNSIVPIQNSDNPSFIIKNKKFDLYKIVHIIGNLQAKAPKKLKVNIDKFHDSFISIEDNTVVIDRFNMHFVCLGVDGGRDALYQQMQMNPLLFKAMLQQEPIDEYFQVFKREMFVPYVKEQLPKAFHRIVISVDPNSKKTDNGSECGITVWGQHNRGLYLLDFPHGRWSPIQTESKILHLVDKYPDYTVILMEDTASGSSIASYMRRDYGLHIKTIIPSGSKQNRAQKAVFDEIKIEKDMVSRITQAAHIVGRSENDDINNIVEKMTLYVPDKTLNKDVDYYIEQMLTFTGLDDAPNDLVDSTTQALIWFKENDTIYSDEPMTTISRQEMYGTSNNQFYHINQTVEKARTGVKWRSMR